jgi:hypothetical protein
MRNVMVDGLERFVRIDGLMSFFFFLSLIVDELNAIIV